MSCKKCNRDVPIENRDTGTCSTCNKDDRDTAGLYPAIRLMFLEKMVAIGAICPVTGRDITMDDDIHHKMGRVGYADEQKRLDNIDLLIDVDFFLAVSRKGHNYIENGDNRAEAIARGWIIERSGTHNK